MSKYTVAILIVILTGFGFFIFSSMKKTNINTLSQASMTARQLVDVCTTDMATQFHIHSHLTIMANKLNVEIPQNIGIDVQKNCMSSVHTHGTNGVIHVEAPVKKDFTLGDFFYKWNMPLSQTQVLTYETDSDHGLKVYADDQEITDFQNLVLTDHQNIFIDYYTLKDGPDTMPEAFNWETEE